jgi:acyl-CoA thioester hydrolase
MADQALFRYSYSIDVRYADLDALAHVNNAKYFTYMETARLHYCKDILGWDGLASEFGVIIAQAACDYKLPLVFGDKVTIYARASRLGSKSFDLEYLVVRNQDGAVAATGKTVQVAYNYVHDQSISIPDEWRQRMTDYEPGLKS